MANPMFHDASGKFKHGNAGGPGNPELKKIAAYRKSLLQACTAKDFKEVIQKLVSLAKSGDVQAIRVLLDRCLGKPKQSIDINQQGPLQPINIEIRGLEPKEEPQTHADA